MFQSKRIIIAVVCFTLVFSSTVVVSVEDINNTSSGDLGDLMLRIEESWLEGYLLDLEQYGPRPVGSDAVREVGDYLFFCIQQMNISVSFHNWSYDGFEGKNIIAEVPGVGSEEGIVVICAHYDSVAWSPGIDDDGSGIACVLAIAKLLSSLELQLTVRCILFDGEEEGLLGSHEYVQSCRDNNEDIRAVLALDKIGYAPDAEAGKVVRHHADSASAWMVEVSRSVLSEFVDCIDLDVVEYGFDGSSDHKSFVDEGFFGSNFVEEKLNPMYHTSFDTLEYINLTYLVQVCRLAFGVVVNLAQMQDSTSDVSVEIIRNEYRWFSVVIENHGNDSCEVIVEVELIHPLREEPVMMVKQYYSEPCVWRFEEDVEEQWEFVFGGHVCSRGWVMLSVEVTGVGDDLGLYESDSSVGLILFPWWLWMV